jgi:cyclic pyranopterin phosphate synthase
MVDVSAKPETLRQAIAAGLVHLDPETLSAVRESRVAKGDVFAVARLAGIMAAKRTGDTIPLCHPIGLDSVEIEIAPVDDRSIRIEARVRTVGRTGVEMEALCAVAATALTIYDMCKSMDKMIVIDGIKLLEKSGGKSGPFSRAAVERAEPSTVRKDR